MKLSLCIPLALASTGMVMVLGLMNWGCYPKDCDPKTDPTKCQCPPGTCGPYPESARDAGKDGDG